MHTSRRLAEETDGAVWANQFDNIANRKAHIEGTAAELWQQLEGRIDGFTCAVGTGGTLAGVGLGLKEFDDTVTIALTDPHGAALYNYYANGELVAEGTSVAEGIGQGRITANLEGAPVDDALQITDAEALPYIFDLVVEEGLVLGSSSAINIAAAMRVAKALGPGHTIVTILCDYGNRYQSKLFNPDFLKSKGLPLPAYLTANSDIPVPYENLA